MSKSYFISNSTNLSRKIFLEPLHPLLRRLVLALLVLLGAKVPPQREAVDLILVQPDLVRHVRLLRQHILDLPNAIHVQQAVLRPQRQTQRLRYGVKVARDGHQARVARERRVDSANARAVRVLGLPVRLEYGVAAAPESRYQNTYHTRHRGNPYQQKPMAPILFVPGIIRTALTKPSIFGRLTPSRWVTSHGPSVVGTMAAFFALSTIVSCSLSFSGGSTFCRKDSGSESPSCTSGM